jgi:hypothetical protein
LINHCILVCCYYYYYLALFSLKFGLSSRFGLNVYLPSLSIIFLFKLLSLHINISVCLFYLLTLLFIDLFSFFFWFNPFFFFISLFWDLTLFVSFESDFSLLLLLSLLFCLFALLIYIELQKSSENHFFQF